MDLRCGSVPNFLGPFDNYLPHVTSRRSKLQEDTYFRIMRILEGNPDLTQREIAQKLGISTGGLNYALSALVHKGWVKVHNFRESKNKFGYVYLLTPSGFAQKAFLTGRFFQRKLQEYEEIKVEIESLRLEMCGSNIIKDNSDFHSI